MYAKIRKKSQRKEGEEKEITASAQNFSSVAVMPAVYLFFIVCHTLNHTAGDVVFLIVKIDGCRLVNVHMI